MGLSRLDREWLRNELADYRYYHAARADLLRRLDRLDEAADAYRIALDLTDHDADRRFLESRLAALDG